MLSPDRLPGTAWPLVCGQVAVGGLGWPLSLSLTAHPHPQVPFLNYSFLSDSQALGHLVISR